MQRDVSVFTQDRNLEVIVVEIFVVVYKGTNGLPMSVMGMLVLQDVSQNTEVTLVLTKDTNPDCLHIMEKDFEQRIIVR